MTGHCYKWMLGFVGTVLLLTGGHANAATVFEMVGVSKDLTQMAVYERWQDPVGGSITCEVRHYMRHYWQPQERITLTVDPDKEAACEAIKQSAMKKFDLYPLNWETATAKTAPMSLKDAKGQALSFTALKQATSRLQWFDISLPEQQAWQIGLKSDSTDAGQAKMSVMLRPQPEPVASRIVEGNVDPEAGLYSPLKVLYNSQYGLLAVILREIRPGERGVADVHYQPVFFRWPDYKVMSVDEARDILLHAGEYVMPASEWERQNNSDYNAYRAYMRLKMEKLPLEDITYGINTASNAGKLYWLALLYEQDKPRYQQEGLSWVKRYGKLIDIIELKGTAWVPTPLQTVYERQDSWLKSK